MLQAQLRYEMSRSKLVQFVNLKNKKFQILLVVLAIVIGVCVIVYIINKWKWDKLNPIFFKRYA